MKTALYIRTAHHSSTDIKAQAERLTEYVRVRVGNDAELVYYIDNCADGQPADCPSLQKLVKELGSYSSVYVSRVNRLAHSAAELFPLIREFEAAGTKLYAADGRENDIAWRMGALPYVFEGVM